MTTAEIKTPLTSSEFDLSPDELARRQIELAQQWAKKYEDPNTKDTPRDAEIILRNPTSYLGDINPSQLSEELQDSWDGFLKYCDIIADQSTNPDTVIKTNTKIGLERIEKLVESGEYDQDFRADMAEVMRQASDLFAKSIVELPGNTRYYSEKVQAAANRLPS